MFSGKQGRTSNTTGFGIAGKSDAMSHTLLTKSGFGQNPLLFKFGALKRSQDITFDLLIEFSSILISNLKMLFVCSMFTFLSNLNFCKRLCPFAIESLLSIHFSKNY